MPESPSQPHLTQHRALRYAAVFALALAALEIFFDFDTWIELDVSIVYGLPLVVAGGSRSRRLLWGLALVLLASTFIVYALQTQPGAFAPGEPIFINRVLCAVTIVLTAALVHVLIGAMETLERQNAELDRRRSEAEAASSRKSRLLASVSHDMSAPLTAINLVAQLIRRKAAEPQAPGMPELARELQANATALADLVSDVLGISAIESGRLELHESEFSLAELLGEECRALEPLAQAKGLRFSLEASPDIRLRADRVKVARVLRNLVNNAIKFTRTGGIRVSCAAREDGGAVLVQVADTGVGIAPADRERIFEDFAQLRPGAAEGWGLGLSVSRRLAELMGGSIRVEGEPGRGSIFTVELPARGRPGFRSPGAL